MKLSKDSWRKAIIDPVYFAQEFLEVQPHQGQCRWLKNSHKMENALHTGNRWGKSFVQAIKFLHHCLFKIRKIKYEGKYSAVNVSITLDQAQIVFYHLLGLLNRNKYIQALVKEVLFTPFPHVVFGNGSVFWVRSTQNSGEYLLGHDFDFVNFDEVAYETNPEYVIEQVLMMRLADREGILDYTSTPKGKNWFYQKCLKLKQNPKWGYVQNGSCLQNNFISKEYVEQKMKSLSQRKINQNILGQFVEEENQLIKEEQIVRAMSNSSGLSSAIPGHTYVVGWDLGRKQSFTVGVTIDISVRPYQIVAFERFQQDWKITCEIIRKKTKDYPGLVILDATGLGDVILSELEDIKPVAFHFSQKSKFDLISNLELMHLKNLIAYPYIQQVSQSNEIWSLQDELRELSWETNESLDGVMALGLALWLVRENQEKPAVLVPQFERF